MKKKIKVLVVDDSTLIRQLLTQILNADERIDVVGTASDPYEARERIKQVSPDVITLDVEMPRMDGLTFLGNLMRLRPMPVVMISTLTEKGAEVTLRALELGAIDYIAKPKLAVKEALPALAADICGKVKLAAAANVAALEHNVNQRQFSRPVSPVPTGGLGHDVELIAIGASTGGTEAIKQILSALPALMPPIVVVQHMPAGFTRSFAQRLDAITKLSVAEFTGGQSPLAAGHVYIANGAQHLLVSRSRSQWLGCCDDGEPVNRHKPAVDRLFNSLAEHSNARAVGILLTGMGSDGAEGLAAMRASGALTVAQNESSSVVWGMPRAAVERGAVSEVLPLDKIGRFLVERCYR